MLQCSSKRHKCKDPAQCAELPHNVGHLVLSESQTLLLGMHAGWHMLRLLPPKHPHFVCPDPEPGTHTKVLLHQPRGYAKYVSHLTDVFHTVDFNTS